MAELEPYSKYDIGETLAGTYFMLLPTNVIDVIIAHSTCAIKRDVFKLHKYIYPCYSFQGAMDKGHLECLQGYIIACEPDHCTMPWDASFCDMAASMGYYECLKYAYENGAKMTYRAVRNAYETHLACIDNDITDCEHEKCLKMYEENGFKLTDTNMLNVGDVMATGDIVFPSYSHSWGNAEYEIANLPEN